MKRIILTITLAITCFVYARPCSAFICGDDEKEPTLHEPIVVRNDITNFHRSLEAPIFAYYATGTISLDFVENLGAITVAVQNLTTGGQVVELIDTGMGNVVIDIDSILTVGDYYMSITTMSGEVYYAEFTLE